MGIEIGRIANKESEILDSWKEIASYLKRGVRTVQRWERTEGLPVRRHQHLKRGSVYALPSELASWQRARQLGFKVRKHSVESSPFLNQLDRLRHLTLRQAVLTKELTDILAMRGRGKESQPMLDSERIWSPVADDREKSALTPPPPANFELPKMRVK